MSPRGTDPAPPCTASTTSALPSATLRVSLGHVAAPAGVLERAGARGTLRPSGRVLPRLTAGTVCRHSQARGRARRPDSPARPTLRGLHARGQAGPAVGAPDPG